jgi:hypothetical protein
VAQDRQGVGDRVRGPLGEKLVALRGDISQKELRRRVRERGHNLSTGHLGQIETGDSGASPELLVAIAVALELADEERQALLEAGEAKAALDRLRSAGEGAREAGRALARELAPRVSIQGKQLDEMTEGELRWLRDQIDRRLPDETP